MLRSVVTGNCLSKNWTLKRGVCAADVSEAGERWSDSRIIKALETSVSIDESRII